MPPLQIARLLMHLEDVEAALDVLERAVGRDDLIQVDALALGPTWRQLRDEPRGQVLLQRLGLPL